MTYLSKFGIFVFKKNWYLKYRCIRMSVTLNISSRATSWLWQKFTQKLTQKYVLLLNLINAYLCWMLKVIGFFKWLVTRYRSVACHLKMLLNRRTKYRTICGHLPFNSSSNSTILNLKPVFKRSTNFEATLFSKKNWLDNY